jgi:hypothetical protein
MFERQRRRVQRLPAEIACDLRELFTARFVTVGLITDERPSMIGGVDTDLVRASGLEPKPHERCVVQRDLDLPVGDGVLACADLRGELLAMHGVTPIERAQRAGGGGRRR